MDLGIGVKCFLREGESVQLPEPTVRRYHSRVKGNAASVDQTRTITLLLRISSTTSGDLVWGKVKALRKKFRQARRGWGSGAPVLGTGVSFWLRYWDLANYTYYDVLDGALKVTKQDFGASNVLECEVTLTCLPFGRGQAVTLAASGTLTNGLNGSYFLPVTVPGDEEAICQITLADLGGGQPINRFRLGRRSLDGMVSSDFTPVLDSGAATGATHGTGDATAQGSEYYRLTPGYQWGDVALFTTTGAALNHGDLDLLLRVRDSTAFIGTPFNLKAVAGTGGGSLAASNNYRYTFSVAEVDAAGAPYTPYVGPSSDAVSVSLSGGQNQIALSWADEGTPTNHLITVTYGTLTGAQTTIYFQTGSTTYTMTSTASAGFIASGTQVIFPLEFQVGVAVGNVGASLPDSSYLWGSPVTTQLGGSRWELRYAGTLPCPPMPQMEGYASQPYQIKVQAKLQDIAVAGSTFDVDLLYRLPHDECQTVVEIPGLTSASTNYTWILDTRRDERGTCLLTASSVVQYALTPEGPFFLGPGGNLLIVSAETTSGVHDIASTYTVTVRYAPRYMDPQAAGT